MIGRLNGDETKRFTPEGNSLSNNVTGGKNVFDMRGVPLDGGRMRGKPERNRLEGQIVLRYVCVHAVAVLLGKVSSESVAVRIEL
jgi:hypothetical protein